MASKIFISYRRDDSAGTAGRLHDRLAEAFGEENLFIDVDNMPAGADFVETLNKQVAICDVSFAPWARAGLTLRITTVNVGLINRAISSGSKSQKHSNGTSRSFLYSSMVLVCRKTANCQTTLPHLLDAKLSRCATPISDKMRMN